MFLITGCGRQGTKYIAKALSMCGLDVRHESVGTDGTVSSFYCFESDTYPGDHIVPRPSFNLVLHQVRNPLDTISSIQTGMSWNWTCKFLPVGAEDELVKRCCYNWLVFNEHAEKQAAMTYQIEKLENVWGELQNLIGFNKPYKNIERLPRNINTRRHTNLNWCDIKRAAPEIYEDIVLASERYGYT